jgi:hypothetical protein
MIKAEQILVEKLSLEITIDSPEAIRKAYMLK